MDDKIAVIIWQVVLMLVIVIILPPLGMLNALLIGVSYAVYAFLDRKYHEIISKEEKDKPEEVQ